MFLSSDPGAPASGSRRGRSAARRTAGRAARGGAAARRRGERLAAAPRALRLAIRFELRAVDRFVDLFFDAFLLDDLRDFAAVFVVFRRFLAMRAPPVECARILSDKLIARVPILRSFLLFLLIVFARPVFADQFGAAPAAGERMPFQRGTVEISVIGGVTLPVSLFRAKSDHQIAMASVAVGRVMAGGPGRGNFELLVEATPFFTVRQPDLVRGWSVAPLFLRWNFPPVGPRAARIFAEGSSSLLFTTQPVPVRTTSFNFMEQVGFGVRFAEGSRRAWLAGYRFQHISNKGRTARNPGANFNFLYLGLSFLR